MLLVFKLVSIFNLTLEKLFYLRGYRLVYYLKKAELRFKITPLASFQIYSIGLRSGECEERYTITISNPSAHYRNIFDLYRA